MKILITAGPTFEAIDPVRYIGNRSSGKMGIAIADAFAATGAEVHLILGPTHLAASHPGVITTRVESAQEMYEACLIHFQQTDIAILAAAVADYRVTHKAEQKIKKNSETIEIQLTKNIDILASLGVMKTEHQCLAGFALETENLIENAQSKLLRKNLDFIVANSPSEVGSGFGYDTNVAHIINKDGTMVSYELKSKVALALDIVAHALETHVLKTKV